MRVKILSVFMILVLLLSCVPVWQTALAVSETLVSGKKTRQSGSVNLTADGTVDWVQFNSNSVSNIARKNIAEPVIQNIAINKPVKSPVTDAPFTFTYTDAAAGSAPKNNYGMQIQGLNSEYSFTIPYRNSQPQNLKVYSSVWAGDITLEFKVNGTVKYTDTYGKDTSDGQTGQCFDIDFQLFDPADTVSVRLYCSTNRDTTWGGASHCLQAITLGEQTADTPDHMDYPFFLMAGASACTEETVNEQAPAVSAIDGKTDTFWHTSWNGDANDNTLHENGTGTAHNKANVENGHWIQVDLGSVMPVSGLRYLPRQNSLNGRITSAKIYISSDGASYTQIAGPVTWDTTAGEKRVQFNSAANARYVLILSQAPALYATAGLIYVEVPHNVTASEKWCYAAEELQKVTNEGTGNLPDQYPQTAQDTAIAAIKAAMNIENAADAKRAVDKAVAVFFDSYIRFPESKLITLIETAKELQKSADGNGNVTQADLDTLAAVIASAEKAIGGDADTIHKAYKALNAAVVTFRSILNGPPQKRLTPLMGWASWNYYRAKINEAELLKQMNALVSTGLADAGYTFFNIDDGFFGGRAADGTLKIDAAKFPNGMKLFADLAHEKGLSAGIYSDAGSDTCASIWDRPDVGANGDGVGLYGYEEQDLRTYLIDWGYDFIKVDWCGGQKQKLDEQKQYTKIGKIIRDIGNETGKYKVYNVCRWKFPGKWVVDVADSWRVGGDIAPNFSSVMYQVDQVQLLAQYHGPGHVNDLDMMQVGNGMNNTEDKTHFSMWCMMSTPLMLGNDLTKISRQTLDIVTNKEMIAINQDAACLQATLAKTSGNGQVWVKDLGEKDSMTKAIALLNRGTSALSMTADFSELGFSGAIRARDLWAHADLNVGSSYTVTVPAHGIVVLKVTGAVDGNNTVTKFSINNETGKIDQEAGTIAFTVPYGTDVTNMSPVIEHTGISVTPSSGAAQDFTRPVTYTVTAKNGDVKTYVVTVTVREKSTVVVSGAMTATAGKVNLTEEGAVDWVQFNSGSITNYAKKNIAERAITNIAASPALAAAVKDAPFTFAYTDAASGAAPKDNYGLQVRGLNSSYVFQLPYRNSKPQHLKVYSSVWAGDVTLDFIVNGAAAYTATYGKGTASGQRGQCFDIDYQVLNPADEVLVKLTCTVDRDTQWGGASHVLQAIALSEDPDIVNVVIEDKIFEPQAAIKDGVITVNTQMIRGSDEGFDSAVVVTAAYDENGVLLDADAGVVTLDKGMLVSCQNTIAVPDGVTVAGLKVFVWDDEAYIPLCQAFKLVVPTQSGASDNISAAVAQAKVANGTVLLDVRTAEEYANAHIDGAINIEHTDILTEAARILPNKAAEIIVYCSAGKRSAQAVQILQYLGYENVYNLGEMNHWYE